MSQSDRSLRRHRPPDPRTAPSERAAKPRLKSPAPSACAFGGPRADLKLEARGTPGYAAHIDPKVLGLGVLAFVAVRPRSPTWWIDRATLAELPEVLEVHDVAGEDCYLLKVRARDAEHLGQLLRTRFARIPGVRSTRTTIVLETVKETSRLPIPRREESRT